jgi:hypothetical protein
MDYEVWLCSCDRLVQDYEYTEMISYCVCAFLRTCVAAPCGCTMWRWRGGEAGPCGRDNTLSHTAIGQARLVPRIYLCD